METGHTDPERTRFNERIVRRGIWRKLRRTAGRVPFAREAVAAWCCATDRKTPRRVKAILLAALAYFVMPADLVPDFVAGLGYTDDITVFWGAWKAVSAHITEYHRAQADGLLEMEGIRPPR